MRSVNIRIHMWMVCAPFCRSTSRRNVNLWVPPIARSVSVYGVCGTQFGEDENHIKPALLLHGTADDFVPLDPCREYTARLVKAGKNVRLIEWMRITYSMRLSLVR
jgi:hypothetical protein